MLEQQHYLDVRKGLHASGFFRAIGGEYETYGEDLMIRAIMKYENALMCLESAMCPDKMQAFSDLQDSTLERLNASIAIAFERPLLAVADAYELRNNMLKMIGWDDIDIAAMDSYLALQGGQGGNKLRHLIKPARKNLRNLSASKIKTLIKKFFRDERGAIYYRKPNIRFLLGQSQRQYRKQLLRDLKKDPNHPLGFLLHEGKLKNPTEKGLTMIDWFENPDFVEMGHALSKWAGGRDVMIMTTHYNRLLSSTIESSKLIQQQTKFYVVGRYAIDINTAREFASKYPKFKKYLTPDRLFKFPN